MKIAAYVASVAALLASSTLAAAAPVGFSGGTAWKVDYGVNQCTAASSYGYLNSPVVLGLVPSIGGDRYKILVSLPQQGPAVAQQSRGKVDFGRGGISSPVLHYGAPGVPLSLYRFDVAAADLEQARSAGAMKLRSADGANFTFALSNMSNLIDALHSCTADLQRYWNVNGGAAVRAAQSQTSDVRTLFTPADFPSLPSYRSQETFLEPRPTAFRLMVDERGAIDGCDAVSASGSPLLETSFCNSVRASGRFNPAIDASGRPVRSVVTTGVVDWGNSNVLNTGCSWVTGTSFGVLNNCGIRQVREPVGFTPRQPSPPPPPPPAGTH